MKFTLSANKTIHIAAELSFKRTELGQNVSSLWHLLGKMHLILWHDPNLMGAYMSAWILLNSTIPLGF
jgi:hypothetical protein